MSWLLQFEEGKMESIRDESHLRQRLMELHEVATQKPTFAVLHAPDGSSLAIGLGRDVSILSHAAPGGWPARHVIGDETNEDLVDYEYLGHFTEMPARYAVPLQVAVDAAVEFFVSGKTTGRLRWEED